MGSQQKHPHLPLPIPRSSKLNQVSNSFDSKPSSMFLNNIKSIRSDFNNCFQKGYKEVTCQADNKQSFLLNNELGYVHDITPQGPSDHRFFSLYRKVEDNLNVCLLSRCQRNKFQIGADVVSNNRKIGQNFSLLVQKRSDDSTVLNKPKSNLKMADLKISFGRNRGNYENNRLNQSFRFKLERKSMDQENVKPVCNDNVPQIKRVYIPKRHITNEHDLVTECLRKRDSIKLEPVKSDGLSNKRRKTKTPLYIESSEQFGRKNHKDFVNEYLDKSAKDRFDLKVENIWTKLEAESEFKVLNLFINLFYSFREYRPDLVDFFNNKEIHVFCKFLNRSQCSIEKFQRTKEKLLVLSNKVFNGIEQRKKGYKVTNNKRFIFRKIRMILQSKLIQGLLKKRLLKRERENLFFAYYFKNCEEYKGLTEKEKFDLKVVLNTYEEKKIQVVWRFEKFSRDFSFVFVDLFKNLSLSYYKEKLAKINKFINSLKGLSEKDIVKSKLPFKSLPVNHNSVEEYKKDFMDSFKEILSKYVETEKE